MSSAMRLCDVLWRRMSMSAASLVPRCGRRGRSPPRAGPWLGAGADPKVVQRILGHASAAMTMDLYGHLIDHNLWAAAQKIAGAEATSERERRSPRRGAGPLTWGFDESRLSESNRRPIHYE